MGVSRQDLYEVACASREGFDRLKEAVKAQGGLIVRSQVVDLLGIPVVIDETMPPDTYELRFRK